MAVNIKGLMIEIGGDTSGLQKALSDVNKELNKSQRELKNVEKALKLDPKNTELLAQKQKLLSDSIDQTKTKIGALKEAKAQADAAMQRGEEVNQEQYRELQREIVTAEAHLKNLTKQSEEFANQKSKLYGIEKQFENVGNQISVAGEKLKGISTVAGAVLAGGLVMASKFEDAFAKTLTIADTSEMAADDLKKSIQDLSNKTGIAAEEIAENVYNAISAGQKTADAVNFVESATKLAKAGFTDSAAALDILTTAMNAYGLESSEVKKVSDLLIGTQNLGKTTVGELSKAMGRVIPTAKANNVEMDQLSTSYAIMTSNGIATAETTTYLNSMLNELGKGGSKTDKILREKTGKSFAELTQSGSTLGDTLQILKNYASETSQNFGDLFGSAEAGKAGLVLLGDGADVFNNKLAEMKNQTGATDSAFEKMETSSFKLQKMINQLKNVAIDLGSELLTALKPIIDKLTASVKKSVDSFSQMSEGQKKLTLILIALTAAISPLLTGLGSLLMSIKTIKTTVIQLWAIISAHPIGALITAISALTIGIAAWAINASKAAIANDTLVIKSKEYLTAAEQQRQKIDELANSMNNLNQSAQLQIQDAEAQAYADSLLADELFNLSSQTNLTAAEKERMNSIIQQLNGSVEGLNLSLNSETGQLNLSREAVQQLIDKKLELAQTEAIMSLYTEQMKEFYRAEMSAQEAANGIAAAEAELQRIMASGTEETMTAQGRTITYTKYTNEQTAAMNNLRETIKTYKSQLADSEKTVNDSINKTKSLSDATGIKLPESFKKAAADAKTTFKDIKSGLETTTTSAKTEGGNFAAGYRNGIRAGGKDAYNAGYYLGKRALQGTKDAQKSQSPAKETQKLGQYFDEGYALGIDKFQSLAYDSASDLAKQTIDGLTWSISDHQTELNKVLKQIEDGSIKIEDAEKRKLEAIERDINTRRKNVIAGLKSISDEFSKSVKDIISSRDRLATSLSSGKLFETKNIKVEGSSYSVSNLTDMRSDVANLANYNRLLDELFSKRQLPEEVRKAIQGMGLAEGTQYVTALLNASDKEYEDYVKGLELRAELSQGIATKLYGNELSTVASEIKNTFEGVEADFEAIGEESAKLFGEGFLNQFKSVVTMIRNSLSDSVNVNFQNPYAAGGNVNNISITQHLEASEHTAYDVAQATKKAVSNIIDRAVMG